VAIWIVASLFIGFAFLVPIVRNITHASMLRKLGWEGASPMPSFWHLHGLRIKRARWEGEVAFEHPALGGGKRGHLRLVASLGRKTAGIECFEPGTRDDAPAIPTGDADFDARVIVKGDAALAKQLFTPEQRIRVLRLHANGGALRAVTGGVVEVDGPLPATADDLRRFLDLCDAVVDGMVASVSA